MRKLANFLIAILLFTIMTVAAAAAKNEVIVVKVTGAVHYAGSDGAYKPLTKSVKLSVGHSVRTGADGEVVLTWFDGHAVKVSPMSLLHIDKLDRDGSTGLNVSQGRVYVKAKKITGNTAFDVKTPVAVCGVRGTEFTVEHTAQGRSVFRVVDGSVAVEVQGVSKLVEPEFEIEVMEGAPPADAVRMPDDVLIQLKSESADLKTALETESESEDTRGDGKKDKQSDATTKLIQDEFVRQNIMDLILEHIMTRAGNCCDY